MASNRLAVAHRVPRIWSAIGFVLVAAAAAVLLWPTSKTVPEPAPVPEPVEPPQCGIDVGTFLPSQDESQYVVPHPLEAAEWGPRQTALDGLQLNVVGDVLHVTNTSDVAVPISTMTGALQLIQQVATSYGGWTAMEQMPWDSCGNSYFTFTLEAGESWTFRIADPVVFDRPVCRRFTLKSGNATVSSEMFVR